MAELTQRMIDAGATFIGDDGIPMRPDGTPALVENQPKVEVPGPSDGVIKQIARQIGAGNQRIEESNLPPTSDNVVGGWLYPEDPLTYGFGPFYGASSEKYPEDREPLDPPTWNNSMEGEEPAGAMNWDRPDSWRQFYTPNDTSTGGGFFFADDLFAEGKTPSAFGGESLHVGNLSTNNYRLLPVGYQSPRYIMRGGYIIDRQASDLYGPGTMGEGGSYRNQFTGPNWSFAETRGYPAGYSYGHGLSFAGWPGQVSNWASGGIGGGI